MVFINVCPCIVSRNKSTKTHLRSEREERKIQTLFIFLGDCKGVAKGSSHMLREKSRQLRAFIAFTDNIEKEYFKNFNIFIRTNKPEIAFTVQKGNVITLQCSV